MRLECENVVCNAPSPDIFESFSPFINHRLLRYSLAHKLQLDCQPCRGIAHCRSTQNSTSMVMVESTTKWEKFVFSSCSRRNTNRNVGWRWWKKLAIFRTWQRSEMVDTFEWIPMIKQDWHGYRHNHKTKLSNNEFISQQYVSAIARAYWWIEIFGYIDRIYSKLLVYSSKTYELYTRDRENRINWEIVALKSEKQNMMNIFL